MTGWFSFLHGEATAGDVLALARVERVLRDAGLAYDVVWSPGFRAEGTHFDDVDPAAYSRLVFVCGPVHGPQVEELHRRFAHCVRIAVGVSVVDPRSPPSPASTGCWPGTPPAPVRAWTSRPALRRSPRCPSSGWCSPTGSTSTRGGDGTRRSPPR